jgi:flagellar biogenesis protein FliO
VSRLGASLLLACLLSAACVAQAPPPGSSAPPKPTAEARGTESLPLDLSGGQGEAASRGPGYYLLRALLSLALVIALIYAIYYVLRGFGRPRLWARRAAHIEVLDAARLDGDKTVYVVALGGRTLVLGASATRMELICELTPEEAAVFRAETGKQPDDTPDTSLRAS